MNRKLQLVVLAAWIAIFSAAGGCQSQQATSVENRHVVGATAVINVVDLDMDYLARIDTGARTTSIHALNIVVQDADKDMQKNIGKKVTFDVDNSEGVKKSVSGVIVDVTQVRNAQGVETRYAVPMQLQWQGVTKKVNVNLRDRTTMTYKLLIGRDWLSNDFLVNVDNVEAMQ